MTTDDPYFPDAASDLSPLPDRALPAWRAYEAMTRSKEQHFAYLKELEEKYSRYGSPSSSEQAERERRLAAHDACVTAFKVALQTLRIDDPAAYGALVIRLAQD